MKKTKNKQQAGRGREMVLKVGAKQASGVFVREAKNGPEMD